MGNSSWLKRSHRMKRLARLVVFGVLQLILVAPLLAQSDYPRNRQTNPQYDEGDWISYSVARFATSIAVGEEYIYFGTRHAGILRYDVFKNRWDYPWTTSNGLADNAVSAIAYDIDTGFIWCATHRAISYYHPTGRRWNNLFKDEYGLGLNDRVESIGIASDKIIFVTQSGQVFETNKFGGLSLYAANNPGSLPSGEIRWFGERANVREPFPQLFMSDGYLFDSRGVVEGPDFRRAEVVASVKDRWGNLWMATWGLGVGRANLNSYRLDLLPFGLSNLQVTAVNFHNEVLWSGGSRTNDRFYGITAWNFGADTWRYYDARSLTDLDSDRLHGISVGGDTIWFATEHGLTLYDAKKDAWKTYDTFDGLSDNFVFDVLGDASYLYVATAGGIDRIPRESFSKKDTLKVERLAGDLALTEVYDLARTQNLLWAATRRGVYVYDTAKETGGFSDDFDGVINEVVTSVSVHGEEIWFGTHSGAAAYDLERRMWLGADEGRLRNVPVNDILASEEAVWAATDQGLMKLDRSSGSWRTFTVNDGLFDNHANVLLLDGDYLWIGTDRGLTQFYWNSPNRVD